MSSPHCANYVFHTHADAERAVLGLGKAGYDMKKLSLLGKGCQNEAQPVGFYTAGDRVKSWGGTGAFWGGIWGQLPAPAVFVLPGVGVVAMAGPVVAALVGAPAPAQAAGVLGALGAALAQLGVPKLQLGKVEAALHADAFLLLVHGNADEQSQARRMLLSVTPAAVTALVPTGVLAQMQSTPSAA